MLVRLGYQMWNVDYTFQVICVADIEIRMAASATAEQTSRTISKIAFCTFQPRFACSSSLSELGKNGSVFSYYYVIIVSSF